LVSGNGPGFLLLDDHGQLHDGGGGIVGIHERIVSHPPSASAATIPTMAVTARRVISTSRVRVVPPVLVWAQALPRALRSIRRRR
jgi:hypothetical protein